MHILIRNKLRKIPDGLTPQQQEEEIKRLTVIEDKKAEERAEKLAKIADSNKRFSSSRWDDDPEWKKYDPDKGGF